MAKCSAHLFFVLLMVALHIAQPPLPIPLPHPPSSPLLATPCCRPICRCFLYYLRLFNFLHVFVGISVRQCVYVCAFAFVCVCVCVGVGLCVLRPLLAPSKYFNKFYNFLSEPKRVQPHRFIVAPSPARL